MKHRLLLGLVVSLFSACRSTDPDPRAISLHTTAICPGVTSGNNAILVYAYRIRHGRIVQQYETLVYKQNQVNSTSLLIPALDPAYAADSLEVGVALPTSYAGFSGSGWAQVEVLVAGQVRKTARVVTQPPAGSRSPLVHAWTFFPLREL